MVSDLQLTAVGNSADCLIRISRQIGPSFMIQVFGKILP
jgi:hypothetical protein